MPTGVHLADARTLLLDAAEAVLARAGVSGLTSRAVTAEAGVAKGVIHRHFPDFDAMLAELLLDRAARLAAPAERLRDATGTGNVVDNLTTALVSVFSPLAVAEIALVVTRDGLRERLRAAGAPRLPLLATATALVGAYVLAERDIGRVDPSAQPDALAPSLIGAAHLLFTEHQPDAPDRASLRRVVHTVLGRAPTDDRPRRSARSSARGA